MEDIPEYINPDEPPLAGSDNRQTPTETEKDVNKMEVHHHPDLHHEAKPWKEYFLEFLMIFLAVTMGFFAETIRESFTEHERAKVFAASMLKDLEEDTAQLNIYRTYFDYASKNVDTLMQLLSANDPKDIPSGKLYWYGLWGGAHRYFVPNDATMQQMKNSGSLRYFEKTVAMEVARYDRFCRMLEKNEELLGDIYTEVRKSRAQLFDFRYNEIANNIYQTRRVSVDQKRVDSFMRSNPPLLSYDKTLFNQYIELVRSRFMRNTNVTLADSLLKQSTELISKLQRKYDLDGE